MSNSLRPVDCSPPSSSIHGILQARILEWVAISLGDLPDPGIEPRSTHIAGRCFNLCATREAFKYKNTVSQKTSYRDTELQIQVLHQRFQGRKGSQVERRGRRQERGVKGVALVSCHLQIPRCYGTFPWASREGRTGTRPYQKSDQTRSRIRVLCQEEVISLQSSAQAEGPSSRFLHPGPGD